MQMFLGQRDPVQSWPVQNGQCKVETNRENLNFLFSFSFRLVPKPNCVKVPKEVCVNSKTNPRVVKKPVIKEWCYRPSELKETPEVTPPTPDDVSAFSFL